MHLLHRIYNIAYSVLYGGRENTGWFGELTCKNNILVWAKTSGEKHMNLFAIKFWLKDVNYHDLYDRNLLFQSFTEVKFVESDVVTKW